jgi:cytochrome b
VPSSSGSSSASCHVALGYAVIISVLFRECFGGSEHGVVVFFTTSEPMQSVGTCAPC